MSVPLRRSTRASSTIKTEIKKETKQEDYDNSPLPKAKRIKKEIKKEIKVDYDNSPLPKAKRIKKEPVIVSTTEPKNWEIVYDTLAAYRQVHKAAVDTMGCERLADASASPIVQRFQTLVALMLSAQTKDTVTSAAVIKLQQELPGGLCLDSILALQESRLDEMITSVGFHTKKASYIKRAAEILRDQYAGDIPDTIEGLTSLPGVGPKMGYLTLQVAWNKNLGIGVDVHVHRIANRLKWCKTNSPEETRLALQAWLPPDKWREINPILVGYGQIVCLPRGPRCDICPVAQYCPSRERKKTTVKKVVEESVYFKKEPLDW